jgi:hypothetical protein
MSPATTISTKSEAMPNSGVSWEPKLRLCG